MANVVTPELVVVVVPVYSPNPLTPSRPPVPVKIGWACPVPTVVPELVMLVAPPGCVISRPPVTVLPSGIVTVTLSKV